MMITRARIANCTEPKLHLAINVGTGEIAAHGLTDGNTDDAAQAPALLRQAEGSIASVVADGAYNGKPVYHPRAIRLSPCTNVPWNGKSIIGPDQPGLQRRYAGSNGEFTMSDSYMKDQGEALAHHLKLVDGKSGYVEVVADGFHVHVRRKWVGKQLATWDGLPVEWHENVGSNKAANR